MRNIVDTFLSRLGVAFSMYKTLGQKGDVRFGELTRLFADRITTILEDLRDHDFPDQRIKIASVLESMKADSPEEFCPLMDEAIQSKQ